MRRLILVLSAAIVISATGCGYLKNVRDDFCDCFVLSAGITPPAVTVHGETYVGGVLPPSAGVYVELTDFIHFGVLRKVAADLTWDRRGLGIVADNRWKYGFLFWRRVYIDQSPIYTNEYLREGNELDPWRSYMDRMRSFCLNQPAKRLIYRQFDTPRFCSWTKLQRGWQGWEVVQVEVAIPEPFILHTGINVRAGVDVSEMFDFVLGIFDIDLYSDNAFEFWSGRVKSFPEVRVLGARVPPAVHKPCPLVIVEPDVYEDWNVYRP